MSHHGGAAVIVHADGFIFCFISRTVVSVLETTCRLPVKNINLKLSEQEEKYSAELDEALKQYAELKEQAAGMDAAELMDARLAVREEKKRSVASRVKSAYGEKYDPMMMQDSKRDVANLLNEETEARSIRERLRQKQQAQQKQNKKKSRDRWER